MSLDIALQITVGNIKFETKLWSSVLVKKNLLLNMFWKLSFPLKVSKNILDK